MPTLTLQVDSIIEMEAFAVCLAETIRTSVTASDTLCVCLDGMLGAGKTTLVSFFCNAMGVPDGEVSSPTFSLQNVYRIELDGESSKINHFDFYRINDEDELFETGFDETVGQPGIVIVEWASRFPEAIPDHCLKIGISTLEDQNRELQLDHDASVFLESLRKCWDAHRPS